MCVAYCMCMSVGVRFPPNTLLVQLEVEELVT